MNERQIEMRDAVEQFMESLGDNSELVAENLAVLGITGTMGASESCPLANSIRKEFNLFAEVDYVGTGIQVDGELICFSTPIGCENFVDDFDAGKYPHLEKIDADEPMVRRITDENSRNFMRSNNPCQS